MWKFLTRQIARAWSELRAAEPESTGSAGEPHAARAARFGQSVRQARLARLRLGMY